MGQIIKDMLQIYKPISNLDWMNYKLVKSDVSYHHIHKKADGGKRTIENGCLLMPSAHQYLHLIECIDYDTYIRLNGIFKQVNSQRCEPTREQRELIEYLLQEFEKVHRWDKGNKGKLLIQRKYYQREQL
jgi:hypothetical protein